MAKQPTNTITKQQMEIIPSTLTEEYIRHRIYTIRGVQVMIDRDLAEMYGVETGQLNRQVKRNADRFPEDFMFQLTKEDVESLKCQFGISNVAEALKCQNGISNGRGGVRYLPYAFTEEGVSTLATVLHSAQAAQTHIKIMRAFVAMRRFIAQNAGVFQRIDQIEKHLILTDSKLEALYKLHKDYVAEIYYKHHLKLNEVYFKHVIQRYSPNKEGLSYRDWQRLLLGVYTDEKDFGKRPLSKFCHDIAQQFDLI